MHKFVLGFAAVTAIATSITLAAAPANAEPITGPSAQAGEPSTERYVVVTDGSSARMTSLYAEAADEADNTYPNVGAIVTELTPEQAAGLDAQRGVTVAPDTRVSLVPDPGFTPKEEKADGSPMTTLDPDVVAKGSANSWGLDRIDQRALPLSGTYTPNPGVGGGGVDAYVIDTGLATQHPEFQGRVGRGYDFVDDDSDPQECGSVPHGTHVAGTIASTRFGVAPLSTIHGVRVLDCEGAGYVSDVIAGMNWVVGERARIGRTVVANMSLGGDYNSALNAATANMVRSGVVTVSAAGNEGDNASYYSPGSTPEAITVAASTSDDSDAYYSNYGSIIDLYAPGSEIVSTYAYDSSRGYRLSGTSMATPHVAGWATLYLGLHPEATPAQVTTALLGSGTRGMISGEIGGTPDILPFVGDLAGAPSAPGGSTTPVITGFNADPSTFYPTVRDGYRDGVDFDGRASIDYQDENGAHNEGTPVWNITIRNSSGAKVAEQDGEDAMDGLSWHWDGKNQNTGNPVAVGTFKATLTATNSDTGETATEVVTLTSKSDTVARRTTKSRTGIDTRARSHSSSCYINREWDTSHLTLDCWGGRQATARYGFSLPHNARNVTWSVSGTRGCCDSGRIIKTGWRTGDHYDVRVRVTGWRSYTVNRASVTYTTTIHR
jgi:subtilisin family serine protease